MIFTFIIFLTAMFMEAIGSYISVIGLSSLFAGDLVILVMAVILDVAKVTSVSFLYKNWSELKGAMKGYFLVAVIVLMTITSSGAFGYLSNAFQKAVQPNKELSLKLDASKTQIDSLTTEISQLTDQRKNLDAQVAQLPANRVKDRQRLLASFKPDYDRINARMKDDQDKLDKLKDSQLTLQTSDIDKQVHIGPIAYIAQAFGVTMEQASKYIILVIISVFDPLAIMLILAGNFSLEKYRREKLSKSAPTAEPDQLPDESPPKYDPRMDMVPEDCDPIKKRQDLVDETIARSQQHLDLTRDEPEFSLPSVVVDENKRMIADSFERNDKADAVEKEEQAYVHVDHPPKPVIDAKSIEELKAIFIPQLQVVEEKPVVKEPELIYTGPLAIDGQRSVSDVFISSLNTKPVDEIPELTEEQFNAIQLSAAKALGITAQEVAEIASNVEPFSEEPSPEIEAIQTAIESGEFELAPEILSKVVLTDTPELEIFEAQDASTKRAQYE
jgi:hypothetical protein